MNTAFLLDEEEEVVRRFRALFSNIGNWQLTAFQDTASALENARQHSYQIYLIDIDLVSHYQQAAAFENDSGADIAQRIRQLEVYKSAPAPIAYLSGFNQLATQGDIWVAKDVSYRICKPLVTNETIMKDVLKGILDHHQNSTPQPN
jgi:hypothetical protein